MAMYELCGDFAVYDPPGDIQKALSAARGQHLSGRFGGWEQVRDARGNPASRWRRPPLIELDELKAFAGASTGMRGHKKFPRAAMWSPELHPPLSRHGHRFCSGKGGLDANRTLALQSMGIEVVLLANEQLG